MVSQTEVGERQSEYWVKLIARVVATMRKSRTVRRESGIFFGLVPHSSALPLSAGVTTTSCYNAG